MSKKIKIDKIKPNPNNPRFITGDKFEKLVESLKEFPDMMSKRPIVCVSDVDDAIYPLGGNMRYKALIELGYKEIPSNWVVMADNWTEEKRREFVIKDNVSFGEWDWDVLSMDFEDKELEDWGMNVIQHDWDDLDYLDDDDLEPPSLEKNTITVKVPEEELDMFDEIKKAIENLLKEQFNGCEVK